MDICFVTPRFPYPATRGDQVRTYHQIRVLSRSHRITLVTACDELPDASAQAEMARWCERIEIVPLSFTRSAANIVLRTLSTQLPLQVLFYESPALRARLAHVLAARRYDIVHASLIRMAPYVWNAAPPTVIDLTDALARSIASRRAQITPLLRPVYDFEQHRVEGYEQRACAHFPRLIVSAQADADALGSSHVEVIRNAVDTQTIAFTQEGRADDLVVLTGNMGYQPNVDAAVWFATEMWPRVRHDVPSARLQIIGARPAPAVRALERLPGIEVTGPVASMNEYLRRATLAICPMRCGSGIQNKLLEAMASGAPTVSTPQGNEGIGAQPHRDLLVAQDPPAFAQAVIGLLTNPQERRRLATSAHALIEREFSWEQHAHRFEAVYAAVMVR